MASIDSDKLLQLALESDAIVCEALIDDTLSLDHIKKLGSTGKPMIVVSSLPKERLAEAMPPCAEYANKSNDGEIQLANWLTAHA